MQGYLDAQIVCSMLEIYALYPCSRHLLIIELNFNCQVEELRKEDFLVFKYPLASSS